MAGKSTLRANTEAIARASCWIDGGGPDGRRPRPRWWKIEGAGVSNLYLLVQVSGTGAFVYRRYQNGKAENVVLGKRETLTWQEAKAKATAISAGVIETATVKTRGAKRPARNAEAVSEHHTKAGTVAALLKARVDGATGAKSRTLPEYWRTINQPIPTLGGDSVLDRIGAMAIDELTDEALSAVLTKVRDHSPNYAHKLVSFISSTYKSGDLKLRRMNPARDLGLSHNATPRKVMWEDAEIVALWRVMALRSEATEGVKLCIKLGAMLAQRSSELAGARKSELTLEGEMPTWRIPALRMKKPRDQIIPLPPPAVELFRRALSVNGGSEFVFPSNPLSSHTGVAKVPHIQNHTVGHALERMRELSGGAIADKTMHDFRRSLSTFLEEHRVDPPVIDLLIHHKYGPDTTRNRHYNLALRQADMMAALTLWTDHVVGLLRKDGLPL